MSDTHLEQLVHLADAPVQPWRNGGGSTRELLAWPAPGAWQLRVSVARIAQDGPFSAYPGVQRCFAVLQGAGVLLQWPQGSRRLTPQDEALAFDGGAPPECRLLQGPTDDLNLMAAQGAGQPRMWRAQAGMRLPAGDGWRAVYAHQAATLECAGRTLALPERSLLWAAAAGTPGAAGDWQVLQAPQAWCMHLDAAAGALDMAATPATVTPAPPAAP